MLNVDVLCKLQELLKKENTEIDEFKKYINQKYDDKGNTLLHMGCIFEEITLIKYLIECGAELEEKNNKGCTPLHIACARGQKDIVEYLIECGAELEEKNNNGCTPFFIACANGKKDVAEYLIEKGAELEEKDNNGRTPLFIACSEGQKDVAEYLLEKGAELEEKDNKGCTPFFIACASGQKDIVKYLLEKGAKLEEKDNNGRTPLFIACSEGQKDVAEYLLEKGAELEEKDNDGCTPFFIACASGQKDIVEYLIECGAELEEKDNDGCTPFFIACSEGQKDVAEYLLEKGAELEEKDNKGCTPFFIACANGKKDVAEYLLEKGAELEVEENDGYTSLHVACINGQKDIVEYLLEKGANIEVKNIKHGDAVQIALNVNRPDIAKCIKEYATKELLNILSDNPEGNDKVNKFIKYIDPSLIEQDADVINILNASNDNNFKFALKKMFAHVNNMLDNPGARTQFSEKLLDKIRKNTNLASFNVNAKTFLQLRELKHLLENNNNNGKSTRNPVIMNCLKSIDLARLTNKELLNILTLADNHEVSCVLTHILSVSEENVLKKINDIIKDDSTRSSLSENILNVMCIKVNFSDFDDMSKIFLRTRKLKLVCKKTNLPKGFNKLTSEINISDEFLKELLTTSSDEALQKILVKLNSNELGSNKLGFDKIKSVLEKMDKDRLKTIVTFARRLGSTLKSEYLKDLIDEQNKKEKPINSNDKRKSTVNSNDEMLLINAILGDNINEVRLLIHTQDINVQDTTNGKTALIYAIIKNKTDVILQLLDVYEKDSKNDISITDNTGKNALMYAIKKKNADVIKKILDIYQKHSCDINITDGNGKSAILYAIENNDVTTAELLIKYPNINFDLSDNKNKNILMYALKQGESMSFIINSIGSHYDGADATIKQQLFLSACVGGHKDYVDHYAEMIRNTENLESILSEAFEIAKKSQDLLSYLIKYSEENNTYCNEYYSYKKNTKNNNAKNNNIRTKTEVKKESSKKLTKHKGRKKG